MKATAHLMGMGSFLIEVGDLKGRVAAELVFCRLNHGSGQEEPGYTGRSMMVGDAVEVPTPEGQTEGLRCAGIGWEPVSWGPVPVAKAAPKCGSYREHRESGCTNHECGRTDPV